MRRRKITQTSGVFNISSPGLTARVSASAPGLGAAISKAQNLATGLQRELRATEDEDDVTLTIRRLGSEELLARVIVRRDVIETWA